MGLQYSGIGEAHRQVFGTYTCRYKVQEPPEQELTSNVLRRLYVRGRLNHSRTYPF